jgi:large subunit ribosomal protein L24
MASKKKKVVHTKTLRVRAGDDVIVISGEGKSNTPRKVLSTLPKENRVIVEGVNIMKDRERNKQNQGQQEVVEKPFPINASNVMLYDAKAKGRTRVTYKTQADGKRARVSVKSGETL